MGGVDLNSGFPQTQWTELIRPLQEGAPNASVALERLCEIYRPSLLGFFCRRGIDAHQAEDLTQNFIASLIRNKVWHRVDRSTGLFRCFLATRLRWFVLNHWKAKSLPISNSEELLEFSLDPKETPDASFDKSWAWTLIREALTRAQREWSRKGRGIDFADLVGFLTTEADECCINELSKKYSKTSNSLHQAVFQLRRIYAASITDLVAETVSSPSEVKAEIAYLMECLR